MRLRQQCAVYGCMSRRLLPFGAAVALLPTRAYADGLGNLALFGTVQGGRDVFIVAIFVGLTLFASTVALLHLAGRRRAQQRETALQSALDETRAKLDRAETFLAAEPQITISWGLQSNEPDIEGDVSLVCDAPVPRRVLGFGSWLSPDQAQTLEACVAKLRERGEAFRLAVVTTNGRHLEVEGRAVTGRAVMRIRDVAGDRLEATRLREIQAQTAEALDAKRALLDAMTSPAWTRDDLGRLNWVNTAYILAVEAKDVHEVVQRQIEFVETPAREASTAARAKGDIFRGRSAALIKGWRSIIEITEVPQEHRAIGIAVDVSELEAARVNLQHALQAHARTLDQLSTAVAIFDRRKQLVFHNAAYRQLWSIDQNFLDQKPSESEILDRLRAHRLLPEQADYRTWKQGHLSGYQSPDTSEQTWYLPDGRTLRVVINPNPQSGVTYLFDDVTAQHHLESQFNAQSRVQRETLDTLKEGVAVFGTDGRLKLSNAAFARLWRIEDADLVAKPHIDRVAELCSVLSPDPAPWAALRMAVAGLHDQRTGLELRLVGRDGSIIDCTAAPLPDGATLLTFTDVTASVNVERALTDRNEALLKTEQLRDDFVHHVSYQLRSPLQNIIGFIQLLGDGSIGSLDPKQTEYVGYVTKSATALLAIINDIMDLATIDTGALELNVTSIDVLDAIKSASEGVQDRIAEHQLNLQIVAMPNIGTLQADPKRVRQVLFNLLSNAIGFSSPGQTVTLAALRRDKDVVFKVSDQGRGIPHEVLAQVFDRFHTNVMGSRHRGVGLGLSIVKSFVELHGGRVFIDSVPGQGTTVTCIFPARDDTVALTSEAQETT